MSAIESVEDAREYFGGRVSVAMQCLGVEAVRLTESYLVDLLCGFAKSPGAALLASPLSEIARRADETSGPGRLVVMRRLADLALFASGFFPESFDRRGLSERHVMRIGGRAYLLLGEAAQEGGEAASAQVFTDLAGRFRAFARVLDEVREQTALCTEGPIVRLYERWRRSGSPALGKRLSERGAVPAETSERGLN